MKRKIFSCLLVFAVAAAANAQQGPLTGSGKITQKKFDYTNFDSIELLDLDGKVVIEVGKPFSVTVAIDDNLESLLHLGLHNQTLQVKLKGNRSNRLYIEQTNILVKISLPAISFIEQNGNNTLLVNGIKAKCFRLINRENGSSFINGTADEFHITCSGNGTVHAEGMMAKQIKVNKYGNGNVYINTNEGFNANGSGNGNVINSGNGRADGQSGISGNGSILYNNSGGPSTVIASKRVAVTIKNLSAFRVSVTVKYPVQGSYGIDIKAKDSIVESLPVGAKLFAGSQFTLFKKPLYTVTSESSNQAFTIR